MGLLVRWLGLFGKKYEINIRKFRIPTNHQTHQYQPIDQSIQSGNLWEWLRCCEKTLHITAPAAAIRAVAGGKLLAGNTCGSAIELQGNNFIPAHSLSPSPSPSIMQPTDQTNRIEIELNDRSIKQIENVGALNRALNMDLPPGKS